MHKRVILKGDNGIPLNPTTKAIGITSFLPEALNSNYIYTGTLNAPSIKTPEMPSIKLASVSKQIKPPKSTGLSEGTLNTIGDTSAIVGAISSAFGTLDKTKNSNDAFIEQGRAIASDALLKSGNPFAMAAGAAVKVIDKTGGFTDASKGLGGGLDAANAVAALAIPGAGYFAPKTDSLELNEQIQSSSAYTGLADNLQTAFGNADAKLLFGANKANSMIANARNNQNRALGILDNASMAKASAANNIHSVGANMQLRGGYNSMVAAKNGAKLSNVKEARRILAYRKGKNIKPTYKEWVQSVNPIMLNSNYDLEKAYNNYPFEMLEAWRKDPKNNHLKSLLEIPNGDGTFDYEFLKLGTSDENPEIKYELNGYYSDPNWNVNPTTHKLEFKDGRYYYRAIPKTVINNEKLVVDYYKQGGSINVIPDGALHARKHHLEDIDERYKDVTSKGIPVVSESEGGELVQHAEVEKEEIIFRLEVTQKLEELAKENTDESAIEAGKLLVEEILYNTKDNTNKLL